jgi:hypothetical protein
LQKKMQMNFFDKESSWIIFFSHVESISPPLLDVVSTVRKDLSSYQQFTVSRFQQFETVLPAGSKFFRQVANATISTIQNDAFCRFQVSPPGGQRRLFKVSAVRNLAPRRIRNLSARWPTTKWKTAL